MGVLELKESRGRISWYAALMLTVLLSVIALSYEFNLPADNTFNIIAKYAFIVYAGIFSFLLFYLKKGSNVRWILFFFLAVFFSVSFILSFYIKRGHIGFTEADVSAGIPTCHISLLQNILTIPFFKRFVSSGNLTGDKSIYAMLFIWFWATVLVGKGWCSWGCFYGGWDNFFSKIRKKPFAVLNEKFAAKMRFFPYAFLIVITVLSLMTMLPVFCSYLCPFKTITEFRHVTDMLSWAVFVFAAGLFITAFIVLPVIFGKRIWCAYLCPFGAFQSLVGKVFKVFRIKIDKDKCAGCGKCVKVCAVSGITQESLLERKTTLSCSLCTSCVAECPKNAISVTMFRSESSVSIVFEKIFSGIKEESYLFKIKKTFLKLITDLTSPVSFLYFFGLTVYFNFFGSFYKELVHYINLIIK